MTINLSGEFDDTHDDNYLSAVIAVGTTQVEAKVGGSIMVDREMVMAHNDSNSTVYFGPTGVATTGVNKGIPLFRNQTMALMIKGLSLYFIADSADNNIIVQEIG